MKYRPLCLIVIMIIFVSGIGWTQEVNLLGNGNFEQAADATHAGGWNLEWGGTIVTGGAPEGNNFLRCVDAEVTGHTTGVLTLSSQVYQISFLARVGDWQAGDWPNLTLRWGDPFEYQAAALIDAQPADEQWRLFVFEFMGKDDVVSPVIGANGAAFEVDDICMIQLQRRGPNLMGEGNNYNPGFESADNGGWFWSAGYWNGSGFETITSDVHSGWRSLRLNENKEYCVHTGSMIETIDPVKTYEISFWVKVAGYAGPWHDPDYDVDVWPRVGVNYDSQEGTQRIDYSFMGDTNGWEQVTLSLTGASAIRPFAQWFEDDTASGERYLLVDDVAVREVTASDPVSAVSVPGWTLMQ